MIGTESLSAQCIIDCLNTKYGIMVAELTRIPLGADIDAAVYKAQADNRATYFVKIRRGSHNDIGPVVQRLLYDAGMQQIIAPIKTNDGQAMHLIDDCTLIVYPFIEGKDGFSCSLTDDQWITLGRALRQLHEFHLSVVIKDQIKREAYSPQWRDAVRDIYAHIDAGLKVVDGAASKLLTCMQGHRQQIQRLVDRADTLAQKIQTQPPKLVVCHSDIHAGNVFIAHDGTVYIVDWDNPILAPKERDLMFIGGGVANIWNDPREEALFYKGYGKTEINRDILAYYRCERIVEDVAVYSQQLLLASDGSKEDRQEMYQHFIAMFEPNGVVDIAFNTDTTTRYEDS